MKRLTIASIVLSTAFLTGCICPKKSEPERISITRTVKVCDYEKTVDEMVRILEENPRYDANDVKTSVYGGNITITVYAEKMTPIQYYRKRSYKLSVENEQLKRKVTKLEKELSLYRLIVTSKQISIIFNFRDIKF